MYAKYGHGDGDGLDRDRQRNKIILVCEGNKGTVLTIFPRLFQKYFVSHTISTYSVAHKDRRRSGPSDGLLYESTVPAPSSIFFSDGLGGKDRQKRPSTVISHTL